MKRFLMLLSAVSLFAVVSGASYAQLTASEITPPDKGTAQVGVAIQSQLLSPSTTSLSVLYAPYLNRNVQVGGSVDYYHESGYTEYALGIGAFYNFVKAEGPVSRTIPYAGVSFSYLHAKSGDWSDHATAWRLHGGVKQFLTESVAAYGELQWAKSSDEIFRDGEKDEMRLVFGLSTFLNFGKAE